MDKRQMVIKGLEHCIACSSGKKDTCNGCPYTKYCFRENKPNPSKILRDALEMVKTPHVVVRYIDEDSCDEYYEPYNA